MHLCLAKLTADLIEGVAILFAVFIVVFVSALNDWRKERQFRGLQQKVEGDHLFPIIRNGEMVQVAIAEVLVGDICQLRYGRYPCDY